MARPDGGDTARAQRSIQNSQNNPGNSQVKRSTGDEEEAGGTEEEAGGDEEEAGDNDNDNGDDPTEKPNLKENASIVGNGGNTVQVSILGMFIILVLAIFDYW